MDTSAFGIEDEYLSKALPGLGAVTAHLKPVAGAVTDKLKPVAGAVKGKEFRPLKFTSAGIRPTKAGVGYAAGAAGLATGAAVSKSAFGVEDDRVAKALTDKQRQQATVAGAGAVGAGGAAGAAAHGTKAIKAKLGAREAVKEAANWQRGTSWGIRNTGRLHEKARVLRRVAGHHGRVAAGLGAVAAGAGAVGTYAAKKKD